MSDPTLASDPKGPEPLPRRAGVLGAPAEREHRVGLGLTAALVAGLGFLPLLGGPRYEAALVAGIAVPPVASVCAALEASRATGRAPALALGRGLSAGVFYALVIELVALLHGLRVGFCDPWPGFSLQLLGPGAGAVLAGAWGAAWGTLLAGLRASGRGRRRRTLAVAGGLAGPLLGVALSVVRFVTSPMVFAFDPYVGYFAGPLYEVVKVPVSRLLTYRAGTLCTILAAFGVALHFAWTGSGETSRLRFRAPADTSITLVTALFMALSAGLAASGGSLGHFSTRDSIREALGRELAFGRCDVVYASNLRTDDVTRLARDCDAHIAQLERFFEAPFPERVTVFLFADQGQKGYLMGAENTYIAKPWRREVYLQPAGFPHPVLGHELAHVVAGSFGRGPFRVAGLLNGLVPDPGRIEGLAVAAAPREDADVTAEQWTAAMQQLGLRPPLERVFRLSFLGESSARAYTVAGAFVSYLAEENGADAVRAWYGGRPLEAVTGRSLGELEQAWHARLAAVRLPDAVMREARARFEAPAIFGRACPHEVDRLFGEAVGLLGAGDARTAHERLDHLLRLDPAYGAARVLLPTCALRAGQPELALRGYQTLSVDEQRTAPERIDALEAAGNTQFSLGRLEGAFDSYTAALEHAVGEHERRNIEVKRWALRASPVARGAIEALLVGEPRTGPNWDVAAPRIGAWAVLEPASGMPEYLLGKNYFGRGLYRESADLLERALGEELPLESVRAEALRSAFLARCALSDPPRARESYRRLLELPLSEARRVGVRRMAERCGVTN